LPGQLAGFLEQVVCGVGVVLCPVGVVEMRASLVDVIDDQPGYGRDVAVPGPACVVGMAITARAVHYCGRFWRHRDTRAKRARWIGRRIGTRGPVALDDQADDQN